MSDAVLVAIITGILAFLGTVVSVYGGNKSIKKDIQDVKNKQHELHEENKEQSLSILRLTVMNNEMPITERLIAGKKYVDRGGNGDVKHYYEKLIQEHTK